LNETASVVRDFAVDVGLVAEGDVLVAKCEGRERAGQSRMEEEEEKVDEQASFAVFARVVTEATDEVAEGSVGEGVPDDRPDRLVAAERQTGKGRKEGQRVKI
jgi:hypothetical protein